MARIARGDECLDSALQAIASAVTIEQLRQAQAVALPLCGMSLKQTAQVTGLCVSWVSKQRNRFIQGKPVGDGRVPARGGRRNQNFTFEQEAALLAPLLQQASEGGILVVGQIKPQLEAGDVSGRGPVWAHQRRAPLLGAPARCGPCAKPCSRTSTPMPMRPSSRPAGSWTPSSCPR